MFRTTIIITANNTNLEDTYTYLEDLQCRFHRWPDTHKNNPLLLNISKAILSEDYYVNIGIMIIKNTLFTSHGYSYGYKGLV